MPFKSFLFVFLCTIFALNIVTVHAQKAEKGATKKRPLKVKLESAREDTFYDRVEALGTLRANESVELTVNVSETITAIHFDDGQFVSKGDILVEMTSAEESALLNEAQSQVREAQRQLERIEQLVSAGTASQSLLDQRQRDYSSAHARLVAMQSRLKDRIVRAPFSGALGLRNVSEGALVRPGDVITTINDNSRMKLDFTVPSLFLPILKKQLPIIATSRAYPEREFPGLISSIDNQVDPVTRAITVRALLKNHDGLLKQGMLMSVELLMNERKAIVISQAALIPRGRENYVVVAKLKEKDLIAEHRQVTVGAGRLGEVEILSGLDVGEQVVFHGAFKAKPGSLLVEYQTELKKGKP